jgi:anti-sigma-K factor RskA
VKLASSPRLDALCGEYLLGALRGPARRRFARACREEPRVADRLRHWEQAFAPRYSAMLGVPPSAGLWKRLARDLELSRYRPSWYRRPALWRNWALAATLAFVAAVGLRVVDPRGALAPAAQAIALLSGQGAAPRVTAFLAADRRTLQLRAERPVIAGPAQSYELWLLPAGGGAPVSLAVLGALDARFALPPERLERLRSGARLAISVEPAGGSPSGAPTGPVILIGKVSTIS